MATDKRERQRANRAQKQAELASIARKEKLKHRLRRAGIWAVIVAATLVLATLVWGGSSADAATLAAIV